MFYSDPRICKCSKIAMETLIWSQVNELLGLNETSYTPVHDADLYCNGCKSPIVFITGELPVCNRCGLVKPEWISDEAEWTGGPDGDSEDDPSRVGAPVDTDLYSEKWGLNTMIVGGSKLMARINMHSGMNHRDRALFHAYDDIQRAASRISLPESVSKTAKMLYRKFNEEKLTRGSVRTGVKANCLLIACRTNGVSRTTHEIAEAFNISTKDMSRTLSLFKDTVRVTGGNGVTHASDLLSRKLSKWELTGHERMRIINACKIIEKNPELIGKTPKSIAGAVTFVMMGGRIPKCDVCDAFEVSVPTVTKIESLVKDIIREEGLIKK